MMAAMNPLLLDDLPEKAGLNMPDRRGSSASLSLMQRTNAWIAQ
jgi:hypothetical protein